MYQQVAEGQKVGGKAERGKPREEELFKKAPRRTERTKQSTEQSKEHKNPSEPLDKNVQEPWISLALVEADKVGVSWIIRTQIPLGIKDNF